MYCKGGQVMDNRYGLTDEQVIIDKSIVNFYKVDPNKQEFLEYKAEQERLEKERKLK